MTLRKLTFLLLIALLVSLDAGCGGGTANQGTQTVSGDADLADDGRFDTAQTDVDSPRAPTGNDTGDEQTGDAIFGDSDAAGTYNGSSGSGGGLFDIASNLWTRIDPAALPGEDNRVRTRSATDNGGGNDLGGAGAPTSFTQSSSSRSSSPEAQRIVAEANKLVGKPFNYDPATKGGRLGCAQVVSQALKNAGAISRVSLGVLTVLADLRKTGWSDIKPPPWKDGDVITWSTYDRNGDGRKDPDTHIGIIQVVNGRPFAVNNSSSRRRPVKVELSAMPRSVSHVLRNNQG